MVANVSRTPLTSFFANSLLAAIFSINCDFASALPFCPLYVDSHHGQYLESSPETASVAIYTAMLVRLAIPAFLSHPALRFPDDFCEDLRFIPLDAMCELTAGRTPVCTENLIRVDDVMESPKLAE